MSVQLHTYVAQRLVRWGLYYRWHRRQSMQGMPMAASSSWGAIIDRYVQGRGGVFVPEQVEKCPVDMEEAQETMRCVAVLSQKLRDVVIESYLVGGTVEQQIDFLGCCKQTLYNRLGSAHAMLLGYFNDVAAGVPLPPIASHDAIARRARWMKRSANA